MKALKAKSQVRNNLPNIEWLVLSQDKSLGYQALAKGQKEPDWVSKRMRFLLRTWTTAQSSTAS